LKYILTFLATSLFVSFVHAQTIPSPNSHIQLAARHLTTLVTVHDELVNKGAKPDYKYKSIRYLSFYSIPQEQLQRFRKVMWFWLNNLSFSPDVAIPEEVPESDGRLFYFYLEDYGWNIASWQRVARREPYFREPFIENKHTEYVRRVLDLKQDSQTLHAESIVRADWLFRETVESDRSQSYYDLLFSSQRFPGRDPYFVGDKEYPPGWYRKPGSPDFVDFPKNEKEWQTAFGVDVIDKFVKTLKFEAKNGAVVAGHLDDPEKGSFVAQNNRLLERVRSVFGAYWKTYDVNETSGEHDFSENFKSRPKVAGELITNLPNGGQAYLLINGEQNRIDVADNRNANDRMDTRDLRVRTPGSCVICHESGIIKPRNKFEEDRLAGIQLRFKDKADERNVMAFFMNWGYKISDDQNTYSKLVSRTSGFKPPENAAAFKQFRDYYDYPIDAETAAREMGVPVEVMKLASRKSPKTRPLELLRGQKIPRRTWEVDIYRELQLLHNAGK
jgi:hypothetical protein